MNKAVLAVGLAVTVPLLVFFALGFEHDPNIVESPLIGKTAPPFVLSDFDGQVLGLEDLVGTPIVLNFWASWCRPCVYENPHLVAAAERYEGRIHFVGVVPPEDTARAVDTFQRQLGSFGPTLYDRDGRVSIAYGVFKLPETYFMDAEGLIREKVAGPVDAETLDRLLESLL